MSDKLENFIRNNRDAFDSNVPTDQIWTNIQAGIAQQAATTAASTSAAAAGKSGLAKIALGWKIAAVAAFTGIVATGIFFVATASDNKTDGKEPGKMATTTPPAPVKEHGNQAEYLYEASAMVNPPLPDANVPYLSFTIDAAAGGKWEAPTGTEITVPAGIFVDAQGQPISGDVQVRYREFHDAEDIILSGITMQYNENGAKENFQTAGMMEILGYQGDRAVYIAPGKSLEVKMASFTPEDNYDLYFLDKKDGWKDIGKAKLSKNKEKEEALRIVAAKPRPPVKGKEEEMDGEVMFNANYDKFPELKPFKGVRWMAEDLSKYKAEEDKIITKSWSDVKLEELDQEGLRYRITLSHKYSASLVIDVKPILEGADYEKGMARFHEKMDKYNKILKAKEIDEERLATQADVYRTFAVSGFGIYNCDRFLGGAPVITMNAEYIFPDDHFADPSKTIIYHITGDNRGVLLLMPEDRAQIKFLPKDKSYLVAVLADNKVGVFGPEKFKQLENQRGKVAKIEFEVAEKDVHNAMDLRQALGI
jgi:hypothetical protein